MYFTKVSIRILPLVVDDHYYYYVRATQPMINTHFFLMPKQLQLFHSQCVHTGARHWCKIYCLQMMCTHSGQLIGALLVGMYNTSTTAEKPCFLCSSEAGYLVNVRSCNAFYYKAYDNLLDCWNALWRFWFQVGREFWQNPERVTLYSLKDLPRLLGLLNQIMTWHQWYSLV